MARRSQKLPSAPKKPKPAQQDKEHLDELLDEALEETFPASDALAMLEPAPADGDEHKQPQPAAQSSTEQQPTTISRRNGTAMPVWLVKATWIEDEAEANEQWEVNADTAHDAVNEVTTRLRFHPHHIEARLCLPEVEKKARTIDLPPGRARRIPPQ